MINISCDTRGFALHQIMERVKVKRRCLIFRDYVELVYNLRMYLIELNMTNNCVFIPRGNHDEIIAMVKRQQRQSYVVQAQKL
jgi:hypothetical protein